MAYTTSKNTLSVEFRDIRENTRQRVIELGGLVVVTDVFATALNQASKSGARRYWQSNYQMDAAIVGDADSEVRDTLRLYFRMDDDSQAHFDVPDPKDSVFLSTTGPGANILKDKAVLDGANPGTPEKAVAAIIDYCLAGDFLISDGETPAAYLSGERVTWR